MTTGLTANPKLAATLKVAKADIKKKPDPKTLKAIGESSDSYHPFNDITIKKKKNIEKIFIKPGAIKSKKKS